MNRFCYADSIVDNWFVGMPLDNAQSRLGGLCDLLALKVLVSRRTIHFSLGWWFVTVVCSLGNTWELSIEERDVWYVHMDLYEVICFLSA